MQRLGAKQNLLQSECIYQDIEEVESVESRVEGSGWGGWGGWEGGGGGRVGRGVSEFHWEFFPS